MSASSQQLSRFTLYESRQGFWIIGQSISETTFRVLRLLPDPDCDNLQFTTTELEPTFTKSEIEEWIDLQKQLARSNDDEFRQKAPVAWGLLGFIRFTSCYYLCIVTKCSVVAMLGGNQIFHIDETKLVPLMHSNVYEVPDRRSAEARLASTFHSLDLAKTFYFSSTYDLTNTLQTNMSGQGEQHVADSASMFVWNSHLLNPLMAEGAASMTAQVRKSWFLEILHGFIDQARINVFGNNVFITLIARRSHQFAGARFYKRGVNKQGYPANEVETEQIVSNQLNSQFSDRYTSYVQHRGSICVSWSQMSNNMSPQPPIRIDAIDPYYGAAAKHFDRMFGRYGYPIRVLNLVKTREKRPRESVLSKEFEACIRYLSQFLPDDRSLVSDALRTRRKGLKEINPREQIHIASGRGLSLEGGIIEYTHWDMSRAAKSQSSTVMDYLEKYSQQTLEATSIFHAGSSIQQGVCRTNCIDCLDRTNAAQSVIAKYALGYQLHALGIIDKPKVDYDTDVMDLLTEMYHDHGDTLALQYGGSNLVNTVETYRRINQWSSHSRDLIESIRRFYSNSFMDAQRQDAINVFLGNYQYTEGNNLWDLATDYYLHNFTSDELKRSYRQWYEPRHLLRPIQSVTKFALKHETPSMLTTSKQDQTFTSLNQLFMSEINSTDKYSRLLSPFEVHVRHTKRRKDQGSQTKDEKAKPTKSEPSIQPINELELLYTKYLGLTASQWQDSLPSAEDEVYYKYSELSEHPLDDYVESPIVTEEDIYYKYINCM